MAVTLPLLGGMARAALANERTQKAYMNQRRDSTAALEAGWILPELGGLVRAAFELFVAGQQIDAALQSLPYRRSFELLMQYYRDLTAMQDLPRDIVRSAVLQAIGLALIQVGVGIVFAPYADISPPTGVAGAAWPMIVAGMAAAVAGFVFEAVSRNRLAGLFQRYAP